jgi:hypothetical protein
LSQSREIDGGEIQIDLTQTRHMRKEGERERETERERERESGAPTRKKIVSEKRKKAIKSGCRRNKSERLLVFERDFLPFWFLLQNAGV